MFLKNSGNVNVSPPLIADCSVYVTCLLSLINDNFSHINVELSGETVIADNNNDINNIYGVGL
jgi:hypothetical protein